MQNYSYLEQVIPTLLDERVLCSFSKSDNYFYKSREEALTKYFIRFGNTYFIPTLSIDIDRSTSYNEVERVCSRLKIPKPNFVVTTTKGIHLHWVLKKAVATSNKKSLSFYTRIQDTLVVAFDGDPHATSTNSARVWRNPLMHTTKVFLQRPTELTKFSHILGEGVDRKRKSGSAVSSVAVVSATVGDRHMAMFDYVRKVAYKNSKEDDLKAILERSAGYVNNKLAEPLPQSEIDSIIKSVIRFMDSRYSGSLGNGDTTEYNRALAKKKADKTLDKIKNFLKNNPLLTVKQLAKLSTRKLAKAIGIHHTTVQKYKAKILTLFTDSYKAVIATSIMFYAYSYFFLTTTSEGLTSVYTKTKSNIIKVTNSIFSGFT